MINGHPDISSLHYDGARNIQQHLQYCTERKAGQILVYKANAERIKIGNSSCFLAGKCLIVRALKTRTIKKNDSNTIPFH